MTNVSIIEELESSKTSKKKAIETSDAIKEIKLLMDAAAAEDDKILRSLGSSHQYIRDKETLAKHLEIEKFDKDYAGKVYTIDQIKDLAIKYNLKFLKTEYFKGKIDIEVAAKIKEFSKETKAPIDEYTLGRRYYILAPPAQFNLELVKRTRPVDPLIFFQLDGNHYRLIHKWGADFTIFRRISGWINERRQHTFFVNVFLLMITIIGFSQLLIPKVVLESNNWAYLLVTTALSLIVTNYITKKDYVRDNKWNRSNTSKPNYTKDAWNSEFIYSNKYED